MALEEEIEEVTRKAKELKAKAEEAQKILQEAAEIKENTRGKEQGTIGW